LSTNGREPSSNLYFLIQIIGLKGVGEGVLGEVLCWFEVAMSTASLRVENTLWNALAAEVTDVVDEIDVYPKGMSALKKRNVDHIQCAEI
jgi:hypothetical protein